MALTGRKASAVVGCLGLCAAAAVPGMPGDGGRASPGEAGARPAITMVIGPAETENRRAESVVEAPAAPDETAMTFDGRPIRQVRTLRMKVTAYTPGPESCGKWADGVTASGKSVHINGMRLAAADTRLLPFGTILTIPGYHDGQPIQVWDRGGAIKGHRLDVLYASVATARRWGVRELDVDVWEYAD